MVLSISVSHNFLYLLLNFIDFRPFERTVTMHKDSTGYIGFQFKDGKIIALVKDSSAARNGLLTDHQILEVNGKVRYDKKTLICLSLIDKFTKYTYYFTK